MSFNVSPGSFQQHEYDGISSHREPSAGGFDVSCEQDSRVPAGSEETGAEPGAGGCIQSGDGNTPVGDDGTCVEPTATENDDVPVWLAQDAGEGLAGVIDDDVKVPDARDAPMIPLDSLEMRTHVGDIIGQDCIPALVEWIMKSPASKNIINTLPQKQLILAHYAASTVFSGMHNHLVGKCGAVGLGFTKQLVESAYFRVLALLIPTESAEDYMDHFREKIQFGPRSDSDNMLFWNLASHTKDWFETQAQLDGSDSQA